MERAGGRDVHAVGTHELRRGGRTRFPRIRSRTVRRIGLQQINGYALIALDADPGSEFLTA